MMKVPGWLIRKCDALQGEYAAAENHWFGALNLVISAVDCFEPFTVGSGCIGRQDVLFCSEMPPAAYEA